MRALLVIADIGGYTRFMKLHRMSLAHAQENTGRLLKAVIDAAPRLRLVDVEGDAAFFHVPEPEDEAVAGTIAGLAAGMHRAFHAQQEEMTARKLCLCDACAQTGRLRVKFVAHLGDAVATSIKRTTNLAGVDVILAHRLLKNSVPVDEYLLMTEPVLERSDAAVHDRAVPIEEEIEDLGPQRLHYLDLAEYGDEVLPPPAPSLAEKILFEAGRTARSLPYFVGLKRSRFRGAY